MKSTQERIYENYVPKVSIVLPTYNGKKYLKESIDSVVNQTFKDWELIIVDDCSTDGTEILVEEIAKKDSRIKVIHNAFNKTLPGALNAGFSLAKGEYYTWTSDDNMYLASAIREMVQYLDNNISYDMVCTGMLIVDDSLKFIQEAPKYDSEIMYTDDLVGACFMYRSSVADRIGEYDISLFCVEDFEYWVRILESGSKIGYISGCYYIYRTHDNNLSTKHSKKVVTQRAMHYLKHLKWVLSGIKKDKEKVIWLYNYIISNGIELDEKSKKEFTKIQPFFDYDVNVPRDKRFIVYGAGKIGGEIGNRLGDAVAFYTDKDPSKVGKQYKNALIISVEEACNLLNNTEDHHLIIAIGYEKQLEVMRALVGLGIKRFSIFTHLCN